jgi:hypothetical protein
VGHGVSGANGSAPSVTAPTAGRPELLRTGRSTELLNALQSMEERISDRLQLNVDHQVLSNVVFLLSYVTCATADFLCICSNIFCVVFLFREDSCIGWKGALSSKLMPALDTCIHFFPTGDRCIRLAYDNGELLS